MLPVPAEEILPLLGLMFLRLGAPMVMILLLGTLAQRTGRLQV